MNSYAPLCALIRNRLWCDFQNAIIGAMKNDNVLSFNKKITPSGWLRMAELPIRRTLADDLCKKGVLLSVLVGRPGSKRGVRLVSLESLNAYLMGLANEQRPRTSASSQAVENQS